LEEIALKNREELKQLEFALEVSKDSEGLAKSGYLPGLSLAADYGFQGEEYKFGKEDDYWIASLVLQWNLFNGFQDNAKVERAQIELKSLYAKIKETEDLIRLQTKEVFNKFNLAGKTIIAADNKLKGYKDAFRIVSRKYQEGLTSQLEYLDAQNKYTQAEVEKIIAEFDHLAAYAELEKISASLNLNKIEKEIMK